MRKTITWILVLAAITAAGYGVWHWQAHKHGVTQPQEKAAGYHCPMHPNVKSDHPGDCPICGMHLVPDEKPAGQKTPGVVELSPEKQQWIGLKTETVEPGASSEMLRAPGRVLVDEKRLLRVQTRIEGWIRKVHADVTGQRVRQGDALVDIYSPELVASEREYLLACRSAVPGLETHQAAMKEAARARLIRHYGMTDAEVAAMERAGQARETFTVRAPADGVLLTRNAYTSQMVKPEMELYTLADLSRVWIAADVQEADLAGLRVGQTALVEPANLPGRRISARVVSTAPQLDPQTRTLQVRLEAANPGLLLRPELYVNVEIPMARTAQLTVPDDAVVDTGTSQVVYLALGGGRFEPRRVTVGAHLDGRAEILAGLARGEQVVSGGAFLLDSESRLRSPAR